MHTKIWNFKFEVLISKTSNIEFHSSKFQIKDFLESKKISYLKL